MKSLFKISVLFTCMIMLASMASAQIGYMQKLKTTSGRQVNYGQITAATTPSNTPVIIDTISIANNSSGFLEVEVAGSSAAGDGVTGKLRYRYHKSAGTITIASADTVSAITADTGVSGATFAVAATASNNAKLTITGKSAVPIVWHCLLNQFRN